MNTLKNILREDMTKRCSRTSGYSGVCSTRRCASRKARTRASPSWKKNFPLFETIDDLARSGAIMDRLFSTPLYKRLLASRGAMQEVLASSRSASRKKTTAIENLRAIPRVFS
jgi:phosphoenolpyruvate carboxylase